MLSKFGGVLRRPVVLAIVAALVVAAAVVVAVRGSDEPDAPEEVAVEGTTTSTTASSTTTTTEPTTTTTTEAPTTTATTAAPAQQAAPAPTAAPPPPSTAAPTNNGIFVDRSKIPGPFGGGIGRHVIGPVDGSAGQRPKHSDGVGAFRTVCPMSHFNFDDPIVFPGRPNATHLHAFYGNTAVNAYSTPSSVATSGTSTCWGGTANRSAYWAPAVIDTATGAPVLGGTSAHDRENALIVYYKTGYEGVRSNTVRNWPAGLRMVAGSASSTSPQPENVVHYECLDTPNAMRSPHFPKCPPGSLFVMVVAFPQCWDGRNLDSPDHKSHMAYGAGWPDKGCPASHPVPLPQITQNFRFRVPAGGMSTWRLASDMYNGPAGYSGHADWMNGWDQAVFQRIVDNCFRHGLDCQMDLLGDGQKLMK